MPKFVNIFDTNWFNKLKPSTPENSQDANTKDLVNTWYDESGETDTNLKANKWLLQLAANKVISLKELCELFYDKIINHKLPSGKYSLNRLSGGQDVDNILDILNELYYTRVSQTQVPQTILINKFSKRVVGTGSYILVPINVNMEISLAIAGNMRDDGQNPTVVVPFKIVPILARYNFTNRDQDGANPLDDWGITKGVSYLSPKNILGSDNILDNDLSGNSLSWYTGNYPLANPLRSNIDVNNSEELENSPILPSIEPIDGISQSSEPNMIRPSTSMCSTLTLYMDYIGGTDQGHPTWIPFETALLSTVIQFPNNVCDTNINIKYTDRAKLLMNTLTVERNKTVVKIYIKYNLVDNYPTYIVDIDYENIDG